MSGGSGVHPVLMSTVVWLLIPAVPVLGQHSMATVGSFGYQLHGYTDGALEAIRTAPVDLMVVDYSHDGSTSGEFRPDLVARLRGAGSGGRPKRLLAYMSIGEAETYRFYFDRRWVAPDPAKRPKGPFELTAKAPRFLCAPNPKWPDNFKVRYWDPDWRRIVVLAAPTGGRSYLDRIIDAGFDGVYLDIIDAFEHFGPKEDGGTGERPEAARNMRELVAAIARHARVDRGRPGFLVVPQNGPGIIEQACTADEARTYLETIDAIGVEDLFHYGTLEENNPPNLQKETLAQLRAFVRAGKPVLSIEYLSPDRPNPKKLRFPTTIDGYRRKARAEGFLPLATIRALDRFVRP